MKPTDDLFALLAAAKADPTAAHLVRHRGPAVSRRAERFARAAQAAGVDVTTDFRPGDHVWSLWDAVIQDVIAWLPGAALARLTT